MDHMTKTTVVCAECEVRGILYEFESGEIQSMETCGVCEGMGEIEEGGIDE